MVANNTYVPQYLRMSNDELDQYLQAHGEDDQFIYNIVIAVHYVFHPESDGLALLDMINHKVPRYSANSIENSKEDIRNGTVDYVDCIMRLWTRPEMIYYGV